MWPLCVILEMFYYHDQTNDIFVLQRSTVLNQSTVQSQMLPV